MLYSGTYKSVEWGFRAGFARPWPLLFPNTRGSAMSLLPSATIADIARSDRQTVTLTGWVASKTEKGKLIFIRLRDGSGTIQ